MNNFYPIIGIAGKAGSGKTTTATFLSDTYNGCSIALADPIKRLLFQLGASEEALWGPSDLRSGPLDIAWDSDRISNEADILCKELGLTEARYLAQLKNTIWSLHNSSIRTGLKSVGTEWGRRIDPRIWIKYGIKQADFFLTNDFKYDQVHDIADKQGLYDYAFLSDLRFRDEILAVKAIGGLVIKLVGATDNKDTHVSETELDTVPDHFFNAIVYNNGDVAALYSKLILTMYDAYGDRRGRALAKPFTVSA